MKKCFFLIDVFFNVEFVAESEIHFCRSPLFLEKLEL